MPAKVAHLTLSEFLKFHLAALSSVMPVKVTEKLGVAALLTMMTVLSGCDQAPSNASTNSGSDGSAAQKINLLNVSYDVSRDFYKDYNPEFIQTYQEAHPGVSVHIGQSHGGSSKQALSVANGLQADVVTMNQETDIELLVEKGVVDANWQQAFPNLAVPYTSTIVFLVRTDNPKHINDWQDLSRSDIAVVMPNPKTSGTARYAFLAAYGAALKQFDNNQQATNRYIHQLLANIVTYDNGSRAATTTFTQRGMGDVLITTENEAHQVADKFAKGQVEVIYPSYSIRIDNPVAVVDKVAAKKGTREVAHDYLQSLWDQSAQERMAKLYLRPSDPQVLAKYEATLPNIEMFNPVEVFGPWPQIMQTFFVEGGEFDKLAKNSAVDAAS